ncbi:ATP-binding cassette domain-containing protein [Streptomyces sp. NHF165]|uniref:ATP-binding cassette domain-containing protein n=1 Tax=Streptomyces sp. NHF165 TaxID=2175864 RepID=UPI003FCC56CE
MRAAGTAVRGPRDGGRARGADEGGSTGGAVPGVAAACEVDGRAAERHQPGGAGQQHAGRCTRARGGQGSAAGTLSARQLAVRRAVLPQSSALAFPFTVAEVVRMGRAPWAGTSHEDEDETAVAEAMAATEVTAFAGRPFSALSGGERARVALARVLAQRTGVLLLDEPTAALDLRHQEAALAVCRERAAAGDAVAVVLHDLGQAAAYADRIALLTDGRLTALGRPDRVLDGEVLTGVYGCPVEVLPHPRTGAPLVLPERGRPTAGGSGESGGRSGSRAG